MLTTILKITCCIISLFILIGIIEMLFLQYLWTLYSDMERCDVKEDDEILTFYEDGSFQSVGRDPTDRKTLEIDLDSIDISKELEMLKGYDGRKEHEKIH